jgi:hypothetical protein
MNTEQDFWTTLQQDFPDVDWDNVPDIESVPNVFEISGMRPRRLHFFDGKDIESQVSFGIGEFSTQEKAITHLEEIKTDPQYCSWYMTKSHGHMQEFLGPVIWDTVKIDAVKPVESVYLDFMKHMREDVLAKKVTFPVYVP